MKTSEVLRAAKKRLVERGWCQGTFEDGEGRCCSIGAINRASPPCGQWPALLSFGDVVGGSVFVWNDAPGRTLEEVLAAFDKAIAAEEAKEAANA